MQGNKQFPGMKYLLKKLLPGRDFGWYLIVYLCVSSWMYNFASTEVDVIITHRLGSDRDLFIALALLMLFFYYRKRIAKLLKRQDDDMENSGKEKEQDLQDALYGALKRCAELEEEKKWQFTVMNAQKKRIEEYHNMLNSKQDEITQLHHLNALQAAKLSAISLFLKEECSKDIRYTVSVDVQGDEQGIIDKKS